MTDAKVEAMLRVLESVLEDCESCWLKTVLERASELDVFAGAMEVRELDSPVFGAEELLAEDEGVETFRGNWLDDVPRPRPGGWPDAVELSRK